MTRINNIKQWWNDWHEVEDKDFEWLIEQAEKGLIYEAEERECKLSIFYEEIQRYVKHFELTAPTYDEFVRMIENTRLTTQYDFEESTQVVCNELMPFRYSYSTFREN